MNVESRYERQRSRRVVVGVDGSRAARQAVTWAAYEARLRQARLEIVHVERFATDMMGALGDPEPGRSLVNACAHRAADIEPELDVDAQVITAFDVSDALVECSNAATVLVLGVDPTRTRASHGVLGPLEDRVIVHALCPVVLVAPYAFVASGARPNVTMGWSDTYAGRLALSAAAEEAALRGLTLSVVSGTASPDSGVPAAKDQGSQEPAFIAALADLEMRYPGLVIDALHTSEDIVEALGAMAARSELLVVGAHHSTRPWDIHVGPVAQALLRNGHCPVMLVGHSESRRSPSLTPQPRQTAASSQQQT